MVPVEAVVLTSGSSIGIESYDPDPLGSIDERSTSHNSCQNEMVAAGLLPSHLALALAYMKATSTVLLQMLSKFAVVSI